MKRTQMNFSDYQKLIESSKNWEYHCTYQLLPTALEGEHEVNELETMQLSYTYRKGGMMHDARAPKDTVCIAVIQECHDKACFDNMKLKTGDIVFFDDSRYINFMSNNVIKVAIVSIQKEVSNRLVAQLLQRRGTFIHDTDDVLATLLTKLSIQKLYPKDYEKIEEEITKTIERLLQEQTARTPELTKGERIALEIRDRVYKHMDAEISITSLAEEYKVTDQTLQNSFKALFGFTPKLFLRLLKLNHVHHDLLYGDSANSSVSKVAYRWGFKHMGHFSAFYTELFGINPSVTLHTKYPQLHGITSDCALRQEEV